MVEGLEAVGADGSWSSLLERDANDSLPELGTLDKTPVAPREPGREEVEEVVRSRPREVLERDARLELEELEVLETVLSIPRLLSSFSEVIDPLNSSRLLVSGEEVSALEVIDDLFCSREVAAGCSNQYRSSTFSKNAFFSDSDNGSMI